MASRAANKLNRRSYVSAGPNFVSHIDGYDKLKPFGFSIHGAIDGYSRKIIWLEVSVSNKNPKSIAFYYLDFPQGKNNWRISSSKPDSLILEF